MTWKLSWNVLKSTLRLISFLFSNELSANLEMFYTLSYITDLVCYTYFHWFFNPECQHIFGKQMGYIYFSPQKRLKHGRQNITLHWINGIIRNNKCIFTKLNAVFILKTTAWTKNITTLIPSQIPDRFSKLLCTITNKQNVEPWKLSTSWGHTKVLFTCC